MPYVTTVKTKPGDSIALRIRHENGEQQDVSVRLIGMEEMLRLASLERQSAGAATMPASATATTRSR